MRALVVFESMFGNTQEVAKAIADGLASRMTVDLVEVSAAPTVIDDGLDLLVVGGPTHAHGMSTPASRLSAARRANQGLVSAGIGLREWLAAVRRGSASVAAAAFDTRIKGPGLLWGSAARAADKELRRLGLRPVVAPESFLVSGPLGPVFDVVLEGEAERARRWGEKLGSKLTAHERDRQAS